MFKFVEEKIKDIELHSISKGNVIPISLVTVKVFAPCDGKIIMVADTRHAVEYKKITGLKY